MAEKGSVSSEKEIGPLQKESRYCKIIFPYIQKKVGKKGSSRVVHSLFGKLNETEAFPESS